MQLCFWVANEQLFQWFIVKQFLRGWIIWPLQNWCMCQRNICRKLLRAEGGGTMSPDYTKSIIRNDYCKLFKYQRSEFITNKVEIHTVNPIRVLLSSWTRKQLIEIYTNDTIRVLLSCWYQGSCSVWNWLARDLIPSNPPSNPPAGGDWSNKDSQ
jgi:hypothetical protein